MADGTRSGGISDDALGSREGQYELGANDIFRAEGIISEPDWRTLSFWDLIKIAFRDHLIDRIDHPVIKRLRGQA